MSETTYSQKQLLEWIAGPDTGISSKTIFAALTGITWTERFSPDIPHDPDDFGRCYRLLLIFPEWRFRLAEVAMRFPVWGPMIAIWDELTAMWEDICIGNGGMWPEKVTEDIKTKTELMRKKMWSVHDACLIADGWIRTGKCSWHKPSAGSSEVPTI